MLLHGIVQGEPSLLDELQHRHRRDRLRDRGDAEDGVGAAGHVVLDVRLPESFREHLLVAHRHRHRQRGGGDPLARGLGAPAHLVQAALGGGGPRGENEQKGEAGTESSWDLALHSGPVDDRGVSPLRQGAGRLFVGVLVVAGLRPAPLLPQSPAYEIVFRGGRVVDGTGSPWYRADVAVRAGRIARIAPRIGETAGRVVAVEDLVVAPGFIDIHTHASRGLRETPTAENYVRQGVTTLVEGPDGTSPLPFRDFLARFAAVRPSVNFASFVGQGSVRLAVLGEVDRPPTGEELARMKEIVRVSMKEGALGLSTGLFYVPGAFSPTEEVIELARVAGALGGIHVSHMRDEASRVVDSVKETIRIGEEGALPTQITHHKIIGAGNWGKSAATLRLVDEARARGVDVTLDQYPYTASSTSVSAALLPAWAREGGREALLARLRDPEPRGRARAETVRLLREERGGGDPRNVVIAGCEWDASLAGRNLAELATRRGQPATLEGAADTALWIVEQGDCQAVFHAISEEDVVRILRHPATMIGSDGEVPPFGKGAPHPRSYGTFARVLAVYVREKRVLTLEEAIRKMSAFPAQRLGLADRGVLREGMVADLVVLDPARVRDTATFERPHQYAEGVRLVMVGGAVVLEDGAVTAARPGAVLYGPARDRDR